MKPDWDKLISKYEGSSTALVADVDCTAGGKDLCTQQGIKGYPTIKYGDPTALEDYKGGRSFDALDKFAGENLKPLCGPANIDLCDEDKKKQIEELQALSDEALKGRIEEIEKAMKDVSENFEKEVEKLQATYQGLEKEKTDKLQELKDSGLGLMKAVQASSKTKSEL